MAIYSVYLYLAASEGGADVFKVSYFKGNIICLHSDHTYKIKTTTIVSILVTIMNL